MIKRKLNVIFVSLVCVLIVAGGALAMSSDNHAINWDVTTGAGGGNMSSANYSLNGTVGQTGVGSASSANHDFCFGFWCIEFEHRVFLPIVLRNYS